jgi:hypothetical protein
MCAFSDAILGTLEPNAAGIVLPALYVASPIACHIVGNLDHHIMVKTLELCSPQVNQIDDEIRPNKMHEIVGKGKGKRKGG